jgi:hypothetical protein
MFAIAFLLAVSTVPANPESADMSATETVLRYEAAQSDHALEQSAFCIEVDGVDVGKELTNRINNTRLNIVPMKSGCQWMELFGSVRELNGQWVLPYGGYMYCEERPTCINAGHAMSALLEKDDSGWRVIRLVGGVWL